MKKESLKILYIMYQPLILQWLNLYITEQVDIIYNNVFITF